MTIQNLIEKYENQLERIQFTINLLKSEVKEVNHKEKRKEIIKGVKQEKRTYKKKHWTQRPENKAKLRKILKDAAKRRGVPWK